jgi:spore germination cell wall hydrolase CwlJ-like protein
MRPKGAELTSFGLAPLLFVLMTTSIGYQDIASAMAQQSQVTARGRQHLIASPFGTIHAATFSMPRPLGTAMPEPPRVRLASYEPQDRDIVGSIGTDRNRRPSVRPVAVEPLVYPIMDRSGKGDRIVPRWGPRPPSDATVSTGLAPDLRPLDERDLQQEVLDAIELDRKLAARPARAPGEQIEDIEAAVRFEPFPEYDISLSLEMNPQVPEERADVAWSDQPDMSILDEAVDPDATARTLRLFFGEAPLSSHAEIVPWAAGEEPILMTPHGPEADIKQAARAPAIEALDSTAQSQEGVTVASKGEVTGDGRRPKSPAEYLGLAGEARLRAEKCLTSAIYFEARGEAVRGQIAVAQVVLNRAFSGYYPHDVCGVVYQNSHRHLACQFTFTCDGKSKAIHEPDAFERAQRISKATLDGTVWLAQVGKATHYHAYWVHPGWTRGMRKLDRIGVHTFYRPRNWGDGADKPSWGTPQSAEVASRL